MTLSDQMVEAAALSRYERMRKIYVRWPAWADADQRTKERWCENARLDLTAALALAEEAGALLVRVPTNADQWDSPGYDHGTPPNIIWADGHNAHRAATLAGRVWP